MIHPELDYTSPEHFTLSQRVALSSISLSSASLYKAICMSCDSEHRGQVYWNEAMDSSGRVVVAFWHEALGLAAFHFKNTGFHTLTSYSYDGELAARTVAHFGLHALRGSSSRGGLRALVQLRKALDYVPAIGLTIDGPKGPRRVAKPGAAIVAARTGTPILPNAYAVSSAWRMRSWDRFIIPRPFARIVSAFGPPIFPEEDTSPEAIERLRLRLEEALNALHQSLEAELGANEAV